MANSIDAEALAKRHKLSGQDLKDFRKYVAAVLGEATSQEHEGIAKFYERERDRLRKEMSPKALKAVQEYLQLMIKANS